MRRPPISPLFPYTPLFRSARAPPAGGAGTPAPPSRRAPLAHAADGRVRGIRCAQRRGGVYPEAARAAAGADRVGARNPGRLRSPGAAALGARVEARSHASQCSCNHRFRLSRRADDSDDQSRHGAGGGDARHAHRAARVSAGGGGGARGGGGAAAERAGRGRVWEYGRMNRASYLLGSSMALALVAVAPAQQSPLGVFQGDTDVGQVTKRGSVTYDAGRGRYTIAGSGANMWFDRDAFHFVWRRIEGNVILTTRAQFDGPGVEPHRKFGWSVRSSLETSSPHVTAAVHGDGDRKSTRLNSSHLVISYAVFCLKKKKRASSHAAVS